MSAQTIFLERTATGYSNVQKLETAILSFPKGRRLQITISDRSRRSDRQNKYFHACCQIFGESLGYTKDEAKSIVKMKFLKKDKINEETGEIFEYLAETHKLNKEEFADLMDNFIRWAAQLGIILPMPDEQIELNY